jgi:phage shock protein PspC (stress-responsive transcriptional regulator)
MVDDYTQSRNPRRLYRSRDKIIAGVCGGVADRMGWDPTIVRIVFAVLFFTGILSAIFVVYIVIWAITPYQPYRPTKSASGAGRPTGPPRCSRTCATSSRISTIASPRWSASSPARNGA